MFLYYIRSATQLNRVWKVWNYSQYPSCTRVHPSVLARAPKHLGHCLSPPSSPDPHPQSCQARSGCGQYDCPSWRSPALAKPHLCTFASSVSLETDALQGHSLRATCWPHHCQDDCVRAARPECWSTLHLRTRPLTCFSRNGDGEALLCACFGTSDPLEGEGNMPVDQAASDGLPLNLCQFLRDIAVSESGGEVVRVQIPNIIYASDE